MMAADKVLYGFKLKGYWADIGQPQEFLIGTELFLAQLASQPPSTSSHNGDMVLAPQGDGIIGNVLIHPTAKIGHGCSIGPNVTIGSNCVLQDGVRVLNSAIMEKVKICSHSYISGSIVGWQSTIGCWVSESVNCHYITCIINMSKMYTCILYMFRVGSIRGPNSRRPGRLYTK